MASTQMTLTDKVRSIMSRDDTGKGPMSAAHRLPGRCRGQLSQFELDLRDWGLVYGMTFGIARTEEAFETNEDVAERAYEPARLAWAAWAGSTFAEREDREGPVEELLTAYSKLSADEVSALPKELYAALTEMSTSVEAVS